MEHLILPTGAKLSSDELVHVPHVALDGYKDFSFLEYLDIGNPGYEVLHTSPPVAGHKSTGLLSLERVECFIQTWLFFGLLQEVLGSPKFKHKEFIHDVEGKKQVLTTSKLLSSLNTWSIQIQDPLLRKSAFGITKKISLESYLQHLSACLSITRNILSNLDKKFSSSLKFVTTVTAEALMGAVQFVARKTEIKVDFISFSDFSLALADSDSKVNRMKRNGWCKYQAQCILGQYNTYQARHFFSHMKKPPSGDSHKECTDVLCVAGKYGPSMHMPKHTSTCDKDKTIDKCEHFDVNEKKLQCIIEKGFLPLIEFKSDGSIKMVPSTAQQSYTALSHVWADGLGNPVKNALPRCQLRRLFSILKNSTSHITESAEDVCHYAWVDTLCCPATNETGKKMALERMVETYKNATNVVVLDASLENSRISGLSGLDIMAKICSSGWMYRLWTLQEGLLAQNLQVQFKDRLYALNIEEVVNSIEGSDSATLQSLAVPIGSTLIDMRLAEKDRKEVYHELYRISRMLRGRAVSVRSDEPLCLGALLGVDIKTIAELGPDQSLSESQRDTDLRERRMCELWRLLSFGKILVPRDMVFSYGGTRQTTKGFRWAPDTLLGLDGRAGRLYLKKGQAQAQVSSEGLKLMSLSFAVSGAQRVNRFMKSKPISQIWPYDLVKNKEDKWYAVGANYEIVRENDLVLPDFLAATSQDGSYEILIKNPLQEHRGIPALLVRLNQVKSGVKFVEAIKQITVTQFDLDTSKLLTNLFVQAQDLKHYMPTSEITQAAQQVDEQILHDLQGVDLFKKNVWETVDGIIQKGYTEVPQTILGLHDNPRPKLFGLLMRFCYDRLGFMRNLATEEQDYCVD